MHATTPAAHDAIGPGALLGVDVGGTFTDAVLLTSTGAFHAAKVLTTTGDQSVGVMEAIRQVRSASGNALIARFAHGTTVATNALLERRLARSVAVFTDGFEDVLELARQDRPDLYRLDRARPAPLVPAARCVGLAERMTVRGTLLAPSDEAVAATVASVAGHAPEAVAICLLHSYLDPRHEHRIATALRERLPGIHVVASSELSREFREFERASTTVIDASLTPVLAPYLRALADCAAADDLPEPLVMQSNAGLDALDVVTGHGARAVLSGPAGGLVAADALRRQLGEGALLCFDMGGTSCDVAVVTEAGIPRGSGRDIGGFPMQLETVDMHTIGSGGSSIVWLDEGGSLRVGPRSAGADPGPAAYARGGDRLTITDCHLIVGNLEPGSMRQWGIELDLDAARAAARQLGAGVVDAVAQGALAVATTQMTEAARVVSVARGHHPDSFALLAYGGAGALHACDVARQLGVRRVVVPLGAGVLSAFGLACADVRAELSRTVHLLHDTQGDVPHVDGIADVQAWLDDTARHLEAGLAAHLDVSSVDVSRSLTCLMRFAGQAYELPVAVSLNRAGATDIADTLRSAASDFRRQHRARYGFEPNVPLETVTLRLAVEVSAPTITMPAAGPGTLDEAGLERLTRHLPQVAAGGVAIDLPHGTCLVPAGWKLSSVLAGCLVLDHDGGAS